MLDLDTLGIGTTVVEVGDALRSWCNPSGEGSEDAIFNLGLAGAVLRGYRSGSDGLLAAEELEALPLAVVTVALELAARFAADAYEGSYFRFDPRRYRSLFEQNHAKTRGQFAIACDALRKRAEFSELCLGLPACRHQL